MDKSIDTITGSLGGERVQYKIGDNIVHWNYGPGTVVAIDQKDIAGVTQQYYVVQVDLLKLWVPVDGVDESSIRFPTESIQFAALFDILRRPGERFPDHQYQRRLELQQRTKKRTLANLCQVIRDLTDWSRDHTLNQYEASVLSRSEEHLLGEWVISLGVERSNAEGELEILLRGDLSDTKDR